MGVIPWGFIHMQWTEKFEEALPDSSMRANIEFSQDSRPEKVNAGIGMIRDEKTGEAFVPEVVKRIGKEICFEDVRYLISSGHQGYIESHARELVFGKNLWGELYETEKKKKSNTVVWAQTLGGTGGLAWTAQLLERALPREQRVLLLDPGWPNYRLIFKNFSITTYVHEDPETREYHHAEYIEILRNHPAGCPVLLQVCGYNDDGTERSAEQWDEIVAVIVERQLLPVLDFAYNGLAEGWEKDAYAVRKLAREGIPAFICVSNSKNVAYNARLGSLYIVNIPSEHATKMQQTLAHRMIRASYSSPPAISAQTVTRILNDETLRREYRNEIDDVRENILNSNRKRFAEALGPNFHWILKKRGLFLKLLPEGFSDEQIHFLKDQHAIHGPKSSRINIGGFPPLRIEEIANIYTQALSL